MKRITTLFAFAGVLTTLFTMPTLAQDKMKSDKMHKGSMMSKGKMGGKMMHDKMAGKGKMHGKMAKGKMAGKGKMHKGGMMHKDKMGGKM